MYLKGPAEFHVGRQTLQFLPLMALDSVAPSGEPARFGPLVGTTAAMRDVFARLRKYAPTDLPMVITGETGTGKEVVARAVHEASKRRGKPFVGVNCGAVTEGLLEDQLFGHVRGAFTGADRDRPGLFVEADGGTLFFDELGEMSPAMQAKLLRVLERGEVRPVGASKERRVDVRVLAATNVSLAAALNRGAFREDLFFRMAQVTVELPPLRDRIEDLPLLVRELLTELHRPDVTVDETALRLLQARSWPGNVRELRALLARAVVGANEGVLSLDDAFRAAPSVQPPRPQAPLESVMASMTWTSAKEELRRRYFTWLYGACRGNVTQIARRAGIERPAARKALRSLALDTGDDERRG